jgi:hypothetical protein
MKYLKGYKLYTENYKETSWADVINGEEATITIQDVEDYLKDEPVIEIPVAEIKDMSIHKSKTDEPTLKRVSAADLNFPIIITKGLDGKYTMILDGHHRLQKAINTNQEAIKAKVLDLKSAPDKYKFMFR